MFWAQGCTAHLARPDGSTVPIDITSSETSGVSAYDEHVGCITVIDQYFGWITAVSYIIITVGIAVIRTIRVWGILERVLIQRHEAVTLGYVYVESHFKMS